MIKCEHEYTAIHTYGCYEIAGKPRDFPMNEVLLCDECGNELWQKIKDSVSAQHMHYHVRQLPK